MGVLCTALYWSYASRHSEGRTIIILSLSLVVLFTALGASATSISTLIIMRVLSSAGAAGIIIAGMTVVEDIWETEEKGFAMGIYFLGPLTSSALGPVTGGLLVHRWGWRALQWFLSAFAGSMLLSVVLFFPETKRRICSSCPRNPSAFNSFASESLYNYLYRSLRRRSGTVFAALVNPLRVFFYLRYPFIVILLYLAAFSYALTAIFAITVQSIFSASPYNYDSLVIGLLFLPYAFGAIAASLFGGKWSDYVMRKRSITYSVESGTTIDIFVPENRVQQNAWAAFCIMPIALVTLGWSLHAHLIWIVPVRYISLCYRFGSIG